MNTLLKLKIATAASALALSGATFADAHGDKKVLREATYPEVKAEVEADPKEFEGRVAKDASGLSAESTTFDKNVKYRDRYTANEKEYPNDNKETTFDNKNVKNIEGSETTKGEFDPLDNKETTFDNKNVKTQ